MDFYEKEYKDMVQRARELHESGNALTKLQMEIVCPALAESEDERIRKELLEEIEFIVPRDDETDSEGLILPSYHARIDRYKSYLEKQKEQKPAEWNEEDKNRFNNLCSVIDESEHWNDVSKQAFKDWLKSLRPQPKQEWQIKEGNKVIIHCRKDRKEDIITIFDGKVGEVTHVWDAKRNPWGHIGVRLDNGCNSGFYEDELEVLGEPHWKPSEDEERLINTSISFLKDFADKVYENAVECIDWLKSKLNGTSTNAK